MAHNHHTHNNIYFYISTSISIIQATIVILSMIFFITTFCYCQYFYGMGFKSAKRLCWDCNWSGTCVISLDDYISILLLSYFISSGALQCPDVLLSSSMIIVASPMTNLRHGYIVLLSSSIITISFIQYHHANTTLNHYK